MGAFLSVILGEITISIAYRFNRSHIRSLNQEVKEYERLSQEASFFSDPAAYRAINREGNEAFGRLFFYKIALSASSLWPVFFALDWLQERYASMEVLVPGTSWGANYLVSFLVFYVVGRVLFRKFKRALPYFRSIDGMLKEDEEALRREES